jgi:hypothetical protein
MDYVCKVVGELSIEEKEFKLRMSFNEIIDLFPDDFKVSPRLRAALRNREIEVYTPTLHRQAKRLKTRKNMEVLKENIIPLRQPEPAQLVSNSDNTIINEMKATLGNISSKLTNVVSRLDLLVTKVIESDTNLSSNFNRFFSEKQNINVSYHNPKLDEILEKVIVTQNNFNIYLEDQQRINISQKNQVPQPSENSLKEDKLDKLLDTVERLLTDGIKIDGKNFNTQNTNGSGYGKMSTEKKVQNLDEAIPLYVPKIDTSSVSTRNIVTDSLESDGTESILEKLKKMK